jgi:hypothetical protein
MLCQDGADIMVELICCGADIADAARLITRSTSSSKDLEYRVVTFEVFMSLYGHLYSLAKHPGWIGRPSYLDQSRIPEYP